MRLTVLASGSSGNAAYLESGGGGVLVDAGLSSRRLKGLLSRVGREFGDVGAVLLTHAHADHTCGARSLSRDFGIPVFATGEVAAGLKGIPATGVEAGTEFEANGLLATFFEVPHDSPTYGVRVSDGAAEVAMATDLGLAESEVLRWMRGAGAVVLEANHDLEWLARGPYSAQLKRRISSRHGHLSNRQAADAAVALAPHGLADLVLAHLSEKNNSPARACGTVHGALRAAGHGGVRVRAALAKHPTPWIEVGVPPEAAEYVYRYARADASEPGQLFGLD